MIGIENVMRSVSFIVPGDAVGKGRPKFARRGQYVTAYTDKKTVSYESLVAWCARQATKGAPPMSGAVVMRVYIFAVPPASWSKKKRAEALSGVLRPTSKPDADNVLKGLCDAMNGIVFLDDKQVVDVHISKHYAETPEVRVMAGAL